jgi:hypothetical protein
MNDDHFVEAASRPVIKARKDMDCRSLRAIV